MAAAEQSAFYRQPPWAPGRDTRPLRFGFFGSTRYNKGLDRFTLRQPMDADPGTKWVYNSGGSQLMSEVIRSATGVHADRYAGAGDAPTMVELPAPAGGVFSMLAPKVPRFSAS